MWSGPRTVSTALMRAWENRPDTAVADEPLYAFYLDRTGIDHPGRDEVIASQPTDWRVVLTGLANPLQGGETVTLNLNLAKAGTVTLAVPVEPHAYEYATFSPPPTP